MFSDDIKAKLKDELDELQNEIMNTVESWDIFLKLQNLVQPARHAVKSLPPCWDEGVRVPNPSDDRATLSDAACAVDDIPTTEEREETASESCEAVTIMDQSGSNVATPKSTTQVYPAPNLPNDVLQPRDDTPFCCNTTACCHIF